MLKDNGENHTVSHYIQGEPKSVIHNRVQGEINKLIPNL